jgi:26S proteasome regulatory subunit N8
VFTTKNNDDMNAVYIATLVRSVIALHNLINNQISNREQEKANLPAPPKKEDKKLEEEKKDESAKTD